MTLIETSTTYSVRHYELNEDKIIKDFGSIEEFEQYEDQMSYLMENEFVDEQNVESELKESEYFVGHKMVNSKGEIFEKEN
tara:strand:+ start:7302 stop:7544 length:243 start_codon:yes stop_codon:yes gene_type:complete